MFSSFFLNLIYEKKNVQHSTKAGMKIDGKWQQLLFGKIIKSRKDANLI
jgi:hypothetical protein